jgi:hypothetical protein
MRGRRSGFGFDSQKRLSSSVYSSQIYDLYCVKIRLSWAAGVDPFNINEADLNLPGRRGLEE